MEQKWPDKLRRDAFVQIVIGGVQINEVLEKPAGPFASEVFCLIKRIRHAGKAFVILNPLKIAKPDSGSKIAPARKQVLSDVPLKFVFVADKPMIRADAETAAFP